MTFYFYASRYPLKLTSSKWGLKISHHCLGKYSKTTWKSILLEIAFLLAIKMNWSLKKLNSENSNLSVNNFYTEVKSIFGPFAIPQEHNCTNTQTEIRRKARNSKKIYIYQTDIGKLLKKQRNLEKRLKSCRWYLLLVPSIELKMKFDRVVHSSRKFWSNQIRERRTTYTRKTPLTCFFFQLNIRLTYQFWQGSFLEEGKIIKQWQNGENFRIRIIAQQNRFITKNKKMRLRSSRDTFLRLNR